MKTHPAAIPRAEHERLARQAFLATFGTRSVTLARAIKECKGWSPEVVGDFMAGRTVAALRDPTPVPIAPGEGWTAGHLAAMSALNDLIASIRSYLNISGVSIDESLAETAVAMARRAGLGEEVFLG